MAEPAATVNDETAVQAQTPRKSSGPSSRSPPGPPSGSTIGSALLDWAVRSYARSSLTTGRSSSARSRCTHSSS